MEKDDEFLHTYFNHISQLAFDKAKEHLVKKNMKSALVKPPCLHFSRKKTKKQIAKRSRRFGPPFAAVYSK